MNINANTSLNAAVGIMVPAIGVSRETARANIYDHVIVQNDERHSMINRALSRRKEDNPY